MYRDVQEPVLNAMGGPNPFQDLRGANNTPAPVPSTETSDPAPNPWAGTPRTTAGRALLSIDLGSRQITFSLSTFKISKNTFAKSCPCYR